MTDKFSLTHLTVRTSAPAPGVWGCGGAWRGIRRARTMGMASHRFSPRRGLRLANDRANTFVYVKAFRCIRQSAAAPIKKSAWCCPKDMTKAASEGS
jgi:hypothetical protein